MNEAREEILGRIRGALADVPTTERPSDVAVTRDYRRGAEAAQSDLLDRLEQRLRDYGAQVERVAAGELTRAVERACAELELRRLVVPAGWPEAWRPRGIELVEDGGLSAQALDGVDGALTGCALAIAETGTLVLDGRGRSGRRAITLVVDHHLCIVTSSQVVGLVPEAIDALQETVSQTRSPVTLISGPSASSDIELVRVEGVHGPRHLLVLTTED